MTARRRALDPKVATTPRKPKLGSGLVMLVAHVTPELRDRVKRCARGQGTTESAIVTTALLSVLPLLELGAALRDWAEGLREAEQTRGRAPRGPTVFR